MSPPAPATEARPFGALLAGAGVSDSAGWLRDLRERGRSRFAAVGLPGPADEDWRQTNVRPLGEIPFTPAPKDALPSPELMRDPLAAALPCRLVLLNGRLAPALSTLDRLPPGIRVTGLADALQADPALVGAHLGGTAPPERTPFLALNAALFEDGAFVAVEAGARIAEPVHVLHLALPGASPCAITSRTLILAGAGSSSVVVETFLGAGSGPTLTNTATEIILEDGARLDHVKVQSETEDAWHVAAVAGRVARGARLCSHNVSFGARVARNDIGARLDGEGAECVLYGLYFVDGTRHVDNHTWLDHAQPHCPSWEVYKGVLAGTSRAVFNGRIVVREGAQKTDAKQSNRNLILSRGSVVHTRPQLEIHANDVKCTHGATIGRLDPDALFYLRSRGISTTAARDLLIHAFADDVLGKIPVAPLRVALAAEMVRRLARHLEA